MADLTEIMRNQILDLDKLSPYQERAATITHRNVVVTAGAGTGKTSTLVTRYVTLLSEIGDPRRIAAITFTDKAAREMRTRARNMLVKLAAEKGISDEVRQRWSELLSKMDSARIGTIHSLCAEIIRAHPAEAEVDPRFAFDDEGRTLVLRQQTVDATLQILVTEPEFAPLFSAFEVWKLASILRKLLAKRLDAAEAFGMEGNAAAEVIKEFRTRLVDDAEVKECIATLRAFSPADLLDDAGDKLAVQVTALLADWDEFEQALTSGGVVACLEPLRRAKSEHMNLRSGKATSEAKTTLAALRDRLDERLTPFGSLLKKDAELPTAESEAAYEVVRVALRKAFDRAHQAYKDALAENSALDFDDLEQITFELLTQRAEVRERWQGELDAVLVDEFQDTNPRQRAIAEALAGKRGCLFIVGDPRQSIYRFRGADVKVFREAEEYLVRDGAASIELKANHRTHEELLLGASDLLAEAIGTEDRPDEKYYIKFSGQDAGRKDAPERAKSPFIEFVFGAVKKATKVDEEESEADPARPVAAAALAKRLVELCEQNEIAKWSDVTLLFRASAEFGTYERALEDAGIPFVTVSGNGFMDRPEVRDLVNILRALADPMDDSAMAGALRSPAFGLSDEALFILRAGKAHFIEALSNPSDSLHADDRPLAARALRIITALRPLVDAIPVGEVLRRIVDATDLRAVLACPDPSVPTAHGGERLWRNIDKLIGDADASGVITVREFLDFLAELDDAEARSEEAPADAEGCVQLMTIHKAKGLQFPVLVLADASRGAPNKSDPVYCSRELGVHFRLDPVPLQYLLAKYRDGLEQEAEALRVLYVALTRAQEKIIINAHASLTDDRAPKPKGWAKALLDATTGVEQFQDAGESAVVLRTKSGHAVRGWSVSRILQSTAPAQPPLQVPETDHPGAPLYQPLPESVRIAHPREDETPKTWEALRSRSASEYAPADVAGTIVHAALERWIFPGDAGFESFLHGLVVMAGLSTDAQRKAATQRATTLITRLRAHPVWHEINGAEERHHEVPYSRIIDAYPANRIIDLLYRIGGQWHIIDFKTNYITNASQMSDAMEKYEPQLREYRTAVKALMNADATTRLLFLDDNGAASLKTVD